MNVPSSIVISKTIAIVEHISKTTLPRVSDTKHKNDVSYTLDCAYKSTKAIIKNYKILIPALIEIHNSGRDEYAMKAGGFLQILDNYSTYFGLKLSHLIFSATEQLSSLHQYEDTTIQEGVAGAHLAISFLERQRSDKVFNDFYEQCLLETKDLTAELVLPHYRGILQRVDNESQQHKYKDAKSMHRQQYFEAFDTAKAEIANRFQPEHITQLYPTENATRFQFSKFLNINSSSVFSWMRTYAQLYLK